MASPSFCASGPRVAAAFISYNCTDELPRNIEVLAPQVEWTFVIDNGSSSASAETLRRVSDLPQVTLIRLPENLGIAAALNVAMREIHAGGYAWAVTMDQDSRPDAQLVTKLLTAANAADKPIAIVAPLIFSDSDNSLIQGWIPDLRSEHALVIHQTLVCMTSGSLANVETWRIVNGFDDAFFIDYVDNEYCLRCLKHGFYTWQSFEAKIFHKLGARRFHRIGSYRFSATHHSAWRRYFITRNRLNVGLKFWGTQRAYVINDIRNMIIELLKILLVEDQKLAKILSVGRGIRDGLNRH